MRDEDVPAPRTTRDVACLTELAARNCHDFEVKRRKVERYGAALHDMNPNGLEESQNADEIR
jgi:hypothetical protein